MMFNDTDVCNGMQGIHRIKHSQKLTEQVIRTWLSQKLKTDRYRYKNMSTTNDTSSLNSDNPTVSKVIAPSVKKNTKKKKVVRQLDSLDEDDEIDEIRRECLIAEVPVCPDVAGGSKVRTIPAVKEICTENVDNFSEEVDSWDKPLTGEDLVKLLKLSAYKGDAWERSINEKHLVTWEDIKQRFYLTDNDMLTVLTLHCSLIINGK